ncbi:MAG: class I SAM-dependent methyltransferase [Promethearchaeota archaeon]
MAKVREIFNIMAKKYDNLSDLWYSWLFSRLHYLIAKKILNKDHLEKILDVGCGTGFQSFLYASNGCHVYGIDIADELVEVAKNKINAFNPKKLELFPPYYDYVKRYNQLIKDLINKNERFKNYIPPKFFTGDATKIKFNDEEFDHINCCGSTLSFIPNYKKAISEMARVLKRKGSFFIEVENRWNLNLLWYVIDPLFRGKYEINKNFKAGLRLLTTKVTSNVWTNFPFGEADKPVNMKLNLFTPYSLKRDLNSYGLKVEKKYFIHSITNIIPCTLLDCLKPGKKLISRFKFLAKLEEKLSFKISGSSLVLYGRKV